MVPSFQGKSGAAVLAAVLATVLAQPAPAGATDFPARQVQLIVPVAAGAAVDVAARLLASKLSGYWGRPVIVENRPGGSMTIAARQVAQSNPDGYSLLFTISDTFTVTPHLAQYRGFHPMSDLIPLNIAAKIDNAIVINASLPVTTLPELIAYARARPTALSYGSAGVGTNTHLAMEMLKASANIQIQHVPYRGLALALTATVANEIQMTAIGYAAHDLIETGRIRAIAIAGSERMRAFPTVPTTSELGYGKVDASTYLVVAAPSKTPPDVIKTIGEALSRALNDGDVRQQLVERYGHVVKNIGGAAAVEQLARMAQESAETVRIAGADKE